MQATTWRWDNNQRSGVLKWANAWQIIVKSFMHIDNCIRQKNGTFWGDRLSLNNPNHSYWIRKKNPIFCPTA